MSDTNTPTPTPVEPVETFSREYVQGLRDEAAKYRNEKKQAVDEARAEAKADAIKDYEAKLAEKDTELAALKDELSEKSVELLKLNAVLGAELPNADVLEVAALVQGTDEDSISESVKRVKSLLEKNPTFSPATDPTQGSGGKVPPLNGDPLLEMLKNAVGAE